MANSIRRKSAREGVLALALVGSVFFGVMGCDEGGGADATPSTPKDYKVVAGDQLCGGKAVSAEASQALRVISGASRFEASGDKYTIAHAAENLVEAFPVPTIGKQDICRIYTPLGTTNFELRIFWRLLDGSPNRGPVAPDLTPLKMGQDAFTAADKAYIRFTCRSDRLSNSSRLGHVSIGVEEPAVPGEPDGDVQALKDAYAKVVHSVALAMAKELRCEEDGGLPARAVLDPA
ncbi:hypothetical protein [Streptomyces sp. SID8111]|uniref:hypothetical protein n=1 Tax=Streptomyces sp. SID8111 TaxID=2706100 RepID=UPI001EF1D143|nr:hypothetical protein [Streptomyces sp. SID8111]